MGQNVSDTQSGPEADPGRTGGWRRKRVLILVAISALVVIVGGSVGIAYFITQSVSHPSEETAQFLPPKTLAYLSVNLRPGVGQLLRFRNILSLFQENLDFQDSQDDFFDDFEDEFDIDLRNDVFPWMGPELAVALVDLNRLERAPDVVAFLGTNDVDASEDFVRSIIDYLEDEEDLDFDRGRHNGYTTYNHEERYEGDLGASFAVTENYVVFATDEGLLEDTIDRIAEPTRSLSELAAFKEAQDSAPSGRIALLYVDVDRIVRTSRNVLERELDIDQEAIFQTVEDSLPEVLTASLSLIDMGIKLSVSGDVPPGTDVLSVSNSLGAAWYLPNDTLALISTAGVNEAWEQARDQIEDTLGETFDLREYLRDMEREIGVDLEEDVIEWMTGELAMALLPSEFEFDRYGDIESALVHAVALIEFDDRRDAEDGLERIVEAIEDGGLDFSEESISEETALIADLSDQIGDTDYDPGYVIYGDRVIIGTTFEALELAVDARDGKVESLQDDPEYSRIVSALGGDPNFLFFINIRDIVEMVVDALSPSMRSDYEDQVAPFTEPLRSIAVGGRADEERTSVHLIITFE